MKESPRSARGLLGWLIDGNSRQRVIFIFQRRPACSPRPNPTSGLPVMHGSSTEPGDANGRAMLQEEGFKTARLWHAQCATCAAQDFNRFECAWTWASHLPSMSHRPSHCWRRNQIIRAKSNRISTRIQITGRAQFPMRRRTQFPTVPIKDVPPPGSSDEATTDRPIASGSRRRVCRGRYFPGNPGTRRLCRRKCTSPVGRRREWAGSA